MPIKVFINKKTKKTEIDWSDLIDSDDFERTDSLGGGSPNKRVRDTYSICLLEVTLNYPRTPRFKLMTTVQQKSLYLQLWNKLICFKGMERIVRESTRHTFELCSTGHVHLHGALYIRMPGPYYPEGIVNDLVKTWLQLLPKKFQAYNDNNFYKDWQRYRCPSICVKHTSNGDTERVTEWETYMNKNADKIIF